MNVYNQIPKSGKLLGIDYGAKKVGIAISDPLRIFASPYDTIIFNSQKKLLKEIEKIIINESIVFVVIGLPIGMNGKETLQTKEVNEFIDIFKQYNKLPFHSNQHIGHLQITAHHFSILIGVYASHYHYQKT